MNSGHSSVNLAAKAGIPVRVAGPEQPPAPPKTRIWIEARNIAQDVYYEFSAYLSQLLEDEKKPRFLRRRERPKRVGLQEVLADVDQRVQEAFERELQDVVGQKEGLEGSLAGFKQTARLEFLRNLLRYWPGSFDSQIFELAPELAPPPAVDKEKLARLKELQKDVDKAVADMEAALQTITKCLDQVVVVVEGEHALLRGTQEENKGRFKDLPNELLFGIRTRLAWWTGQQAGFHEKERPLQPNRRRW